MDVGIYFIQTTNRTIKNDRQFRTNKTTTEL